MYICVKIQGRYEAHGTRNKAARLRPSDRFIRATICTGDIEQQTSNSKAAMLGHALNRYLRRMTNEKAIAERLLQINAIKLSLNQPFTWASGWKSPIYCDNRRILSFPFARDHIKSELCNLVFEKFADAELLAGVATAANDVGS